MSRKGQCVDVHGLHVDGKRPRRLCRVQNEYQTVTAAERPHLLRRHQRTAHIAAVEHHHSLCLRPQQLLRLLHAQAAVRAAGDAVEGHAPARQLDHRPHHGVVLHGGHQHVVAAAQQTLQQHVQALGDVLGEHHVAAVGAVKQAGQPLPRVQHLLLRLIRLVVAAAADVAAAVLHIAAHGLRHALRLGKAGAGVVQIDALHGYPSLFLPFILPSIYLEIK